MFRLGRERGNSSIHRYKSWMSYSSIVRGAADAARSSPKPAGFVDRNRETDSTRVHGGMGRKRPQHSRKLVFTNGPNTPNTAITPPSRLPENVLQVRVQPGLLSKGLVCSICYTTG
eukprot:m.457107 g.457107  ORF g.457107 m.457107 type:complete len:116 (+) comp21196_c0_seq1:915-1262(+)